MKKPIRRCARCKRFGQVGGCEYLEWFDENLCDKVRSIVVAMIMKNENFSGEIEKMVKIEGGECEMKKILIAIESYKEGLLKMKENNAELKMKIYKYQRKERVYIVLLLLLIVFVGSMLGSRSLSSKSLPIA